MWGFNLCQSHPNLFFHEVISHYAGTLDIQKKIKKKKKKKKKRALATELALRRSPL